MDPEVYSNPKEFLPARWEVSWPKFLANGNSKTKRFLLL